MPLYSVWTLQYSYIGLRLLSIKLSIAYKLVKVFYIFGIDYYGQEYGGVFIVAEYSCQLDDQFLNFATFQQGW